MLIAMAHPDDESFGMAGTIARYVAEGAAVHLICATNGDVGTVDEAFMEGYATVADRRLAELQCAADALGFASVTTLGYRDSGMRGSPDNEHPDSLVSAPVDEVAGRIVQVIRETRPEVLITFDPFGGYGHPDHIAMHEAAVRAYRLSGDPDAYPQQINNGLKPHQPGRLYYQTFPHFFFKAAVAIMRLLGRDPSKFGRNNDIDLTEIADNTYPIHVRINYRPYKKVAARARDCHASQLNPDPPFLQRLVQNLFSRPVDTFMQAEPPVENGRVRHTDLFHGG
ncbi:MAG: GlcNAc-PI de-N-acetylase [Chloroflexi bacterium]|nr:GlcNAc-PI de-N-acetylase [Chloroflexota bacterium]